ncbi:MAG: response regulator [Proteobacteria bacterium]|nr:MAG: response regulator [Pseudomonadota bacterium]
MIMSGTTLIIIEDDTAFRELLSEILQPHFSAILSFETTLEARMIIENHKNPLLVLSDIDLPGESGVEHLRNFRADGRTEPFYLMSGRVSSLTESDLKLSSGFIKKPFTKKELLEFFKMGSERAS